MSTGKKSMARCSDLGLVSQEWCLFRKVKGGEKIYYTEGKKPKPFRNVDDVLGSWPL